MGNPGPDAAEICHEMTVFQQTMTLGQKQQSSVLLFLQTLGTAFTAQITLAISHLPLGDIRTYPLTGRINSLPEQPLTGILVLGPRQPAATRSHYCPWRHLTSPAPKLVELQVAELLRKVEVCCKDNQAACSLLPHASMALCYTDEAVSKA